MMFKMAGLSGFIRGFVGSAGLAVVVSESSILADSDQPQQTLAAAHRVSSVGAT